MHVALPVAALLLCTCSAKVGNWEAAAFWLETEADSRHSLP